MIKKIICIVLCLLNLTSTSHASATSSTPPQKPTPNILPYLLRTADSPESNLYVLAFLPKALAELIRNSIPELRTPHDFDLDGCEDDLETLLRMGERMPELQRYIPLLRQYATTIQINLDAFQLLWDDIQKALEKKIPPLISNIIHQNADAVMKLALDFDDEETAPSDMRALRKELYPGLSEKLDADSEVEDLSGPLDEQEQDKGNESC